MVGGFSVRLIENWHSEDSKLSLRAISDFVTAVWSAIVHQTYNVIGRVALFSAPCHLQCLISFSMQNLGHYLLHISFSLGTFSKVRVGGRPLPLYHYSPTTKKLGSWTREATLPSNVWGVSAAIF